MATGLQQYVLLTGSDLGNRKENLKQAASLIEQRIGKVLQKSTVHETEPWGFASRTKFLNQAILIETSLDSHAVLEEILGIEGQLGRIRHTEQWVSRLIDIDILCADQLTVESKPLHIPHKHLHDREFALRPLCELVPHWKHPVLNKPYITILSELTETAFT
ncbi:MAG: 2-amino-4-hydroxy-6-hydroxymethyldihydropteridine diphosphokinase [Bacteroidota bacterium]|jgi:2-amino-4-hydroxy-6-hydroxymethyldihydropteridine diphosphokinase